MQKKKRLDLAVTEQGFTRAEAQQYIVCGSVTVNGVVVSKTGHQVRCDDVILVTDHGPRFVSRGGHKLLGALQHFHMEDCTDFVCLDIGASTGGFTDCLLKHGAKKVYAVDVGYGQLDWTLRNDPRVVCIERMNIRVWDWHEVVDRLDCVTIDVSFISLDKVLPLLPLHIHNPCHILALVKPQFEVGRRNVGKGGVVRDEAARQEAVETIQHVAEQHGMRMHDVCESPIKGPAGNQEYFLLLRLG